MDKISVFLETQKNKGISSTLLMATNFRTGSTLLGRLLEAQTGLAFQKEAFSDVSTWYSRTEPNLRSELDRLFSPTKANVFAAKIMWPQRNRLVDFLELEPRDYTSFQNIFSNPKFLGLFRRDKIAQAISFHIARHTGAWDSRLATSISPQAVPYSFSTINFYYMHFLSFESLWASFFQDLGTRCLTIFYEDLVQNPKHNVQLALNHFSLPFDEKKWSNDMPMAKQRSDVSSMFRDRFMDDLNRYSSEVFLPSRLIGPRTLL